MCRRLGFNRLGRYAAIVGDLEEADPGQIEGRKLGLFQTQAFEVPDFPQISVHAPFPFDCRQGDSDSG